MIFRNARTRNLLEETINIMNENGYTEADVSFCELSDKSWNRKENKWEYSYQQFSFETFKKIADFEYNCDFGGANINESLKIVFNDNSWLERGEYDGSEWWELRKCPLRNVEFVDKNIVLTTDSYDRFIKGE